MLRTPRYDSEAWSGSRSLVWRLMGETRPCPWRSSSAGAQVLAGTWLPWCLHSTAPKAGLWVEPGFLELSLRPGPDRRVVPSLTRSFAKPPKQVQTVCECILLMKGYKELSWKAAKGMMSDPNFLRSLMEIDFDAITQSQVKNTRGEVDKSRDGQGHSRFGISIPGVDVVPWCHRGPADGEEEGLFPGEDGSTVSGNGRVDAGWAGAAMSPLRVRCHSRPGSPR